MVKRAKSEQRPCVVIDPAMKFGQPCAGHYRMAVAQVAEMVWAANWTLKDMEESWPELTKPMVLTCCWYMGIYGTRTWRRRWGEWAEEAGTFLWESKYNIPLPPSSKPAQGEEAQDAGS